MAENYSKIENRLQFVHSDKLHKDLKALREYAHDWIVSNGKKYAEPMVLKYGDENSEHIVLAIGTGNNNNPDHAVFIDFDDVNGSIEAFRKQFSEDEDAIEKINDALASFKEYCGIDENGKYHGNNPILSGSTDIKDATEVLAGKIQKLQESLTVKVKDSDTIRLTIKGGEEGQELSANVKVPKSFIVKGNVRDNIIKVSDDGITSYVNLEEKDGNLVFTVNGVEKPINLPKEKYLESGKYVKETESLVLTLHDKSEVVISLDKLINEWTVDTNPNATIVLQKDRKGYDDETGTFRDVLSAKIKLREEDNLIETTESGKLYVSEQNIQNKIDDAVKGIDTKVSGKEGNIVYKENDGLYATVDLKYDLKNNQFTFIAGRNSKVIPMPDICNFTKVKSYNVQNNILHVHYLLKAGEQENESFIDIPLDKIWDELAVDNDNTPVILTKGSDTKGHTTFHADLKISDKDSNLLKNEEGYLYVSNSAEDIFTTDRKSVQEKLKKQGNKLKSLGDKMDSLSSGLDSLQNEFAQTSNTLTTKIEGINTHLGNTDKSIQGLNSRISAVSGEVQTVKGDIYQKLNDYASKNELSSVSAKTENEISGLAKGLDNVQKEIKEIKESSKDIDDEIEDYLEEHVKIKKDEDDFYVTYQLRVDNSSLDEVIKVPKAQQISVIDKIEYNETQKLLVISFTDGKIISIPFSDFIDVYKAGDGLELDDKEFRIKLDSSAETQKYLSVSKVGGLKLNNIDKTFNTITGSVEALKSEVDHIDEKLAEFQQTTSDNVNELFDKITNVSLSAATAIDTVKRNLSDAIESSNNELSGQIKDLKINTEKDIHELDDKIDREIHELDDRIKGEIHELDDRKQDVFEIDNRKESAISMEMKKRESDGKLVLEADVDIANIPSNILENSNGALYVNGSASNITYKRGDVETALDTLNEQIREIVSGGTLTVQVVSTNDHNLIIEGTDKGAYFDGNLDYGTYDFPNP